MKKLICWWYGHFFRPEHFEFVEMRKYEKDDHISEMWKVWGTQKCNFCGTTNP